MIESDCSAIIERRLLLIGIPSELHRFREANASNFPINLANINVNMANYKNHMPHVVLFHEVKKTLLFQRSHSHWV